MPNLILKRRIGEQVIAAHDGIEVRITVEEIHENFVKLAFDAPPCVRVDRKEVAERRAGWQLEPGPEELAELRELQGDKKESF